MNTLGIVKILRLNLVIQNFKENQKFKTFLNYDAENHAEIFCDTEKTRKSHWKI